MKRWLFLIRRLQAAWHVLVDRYYIVETDKLCSFLNDKNNNVTPALFFHLVEALAEQNIIEAKKTKESNDNT